MKNLIISNKVAIAEMQVLNNNTTGFGNATVNIYSGTMPESPEYPLQRKNILLASFKMPPAEENTINSYGVINFGDITRIVFIKNGLPTFFRMVATNGNIVCDGTVFYSSGDFEVDTSSEFVEGNILVPNPYWGYGFAFSFRRGYIRAVENVGLG